LFHQDEGNTLTATTTNGLPDARRNHVDESRAVVGKAAAGNADVDMTDAEVIAISSNDEEDEEEDDSEDGLSDAEAGAQDARKDANVRKEGDVVDTVNDHSQEQQQLPTPEAPSFGEMLSANGGPIDVEAAFADPHAESAIALKGNRVLTVPSAGSLGTVLTQALKTNDRDLLETCLRSNDFESIRQTITRLPSPLVGDLLQRIAERMHKKPGRAGNLMIWVQWSLVAHGGYLASQKDVVQRLGSLMRVIRERAYGLQPLLTLKGKLDMLQAQLELRQKMQTERQGLDTDEEDEGIIYVEGQDDEESEDQADMGAEEGERAPVLSRFRKSKLKELKKIQDEESSEGEDEMPTTVNGVNDREESDDEDESEEDLIDDEASETSNDDASEDGSSIDDFEELDEDGEDIDEEDEPRPQKRSDIQKRRAFGR